MVAKKATNEASRSQAGLEGGFTILYVCFKTITQRLFTYLEAFFVLFWFLTEAAK